MKRDFEEYFPLPFKYNEIHERITDGNGLPLLIMDFIGMSEEQSENHSVLGTYLVQCANLMPEAARLLNEALRIIEKACIACANIDAYHCGFCGREETTREIKELLAKLEGGAETE